MGDAAKLSIVWFTYFVAVGIYFPYFSLYLRENVGLSGTELGIVLAVWPLVGMLAQPLWGHLADRTGARTPVLVLLCCGSAAGFFFLGRAEGFAGLLAGSILAAGFGTAILPLLFSISLAALRDAGTNAFGRTRVWGTISFLIAVVSLPALLDRYERWRGLVASAEGPSHPGLGLMFPLIAAFTLATALSALLLRRTGALSVRAERRDWRQLIGHPPLVRLAVFSLLAYTFVQGPMALFPVWVHSRGGSIDTVSQMWVLMLLVEIPLVAFAGSGLRRLGARGLLQIGVATAGVRWLVCALATDSTLIFAIQATHAIVVAGLMLGAPLYLESIVPEKLRSTGQAMLAVASVGIGGIVSNLVAGRLLEVYGPDAPYLFGGIGALLLGLCTRRLLPQPTRLVLREPPGRESSLR